MWVKCFWICLISGAVIAAFQENQMTASWPLDTLRFASISNNQPNSVQEYYDDSWKDKRTGPSLSVANPIEVLRNRLLLEINRRRLQKQDQTQVQANREFLKSVGKRHTRMFNQPESFDYYNGELDWNSS